MSDKGDKVCPICTEEMDLTDQQLNPCHCGYQICVWCWNHIMEMAEKDNTEGRCPACRTPYDKEKIVAAAENCERLVAEINSERKQKSQKAKPKASEGKMHLCDFRVILRNLVYIIGLPLNLADEDLLQHREYFGQYGKVLKVSISRTNTGDIQHSTHNSCCVYITYSKEDDAILCIQSVHGFVLDGRPLRASFGTTKYCHAWLRNLPCINPDCLYLHDFGSEEDRYSKDDLVLAFQRSKVHQIIGTTNNMHRSGDVLPPPSDHAICNRTSAGKPVGDSSIVENHSKGSCTDNGKSNTVPAAGSWVMRVSGTAPPATKQSGSGGSPCSKLEIPGSFPPLISEAVCTKISRPDARTMKEEDNSKLHLNGKFDLWELADEGYNGKNCHIDLSNKNAGAISHPSPGIPTHCFQASQDCGNVSEALSSRVSQVGSSQNLFEGNSGTQGLVQDTSDQFERFLTSSPPNENTASENLLIDDDWQMQDTLHFPCASKPPCSLLNPTPSSYCSWQKEEFDYQINPTPIPKVTPSNGFGHSFADIKDTFGYSNGFSDVGLEGFNKNIGMIDNNTMSDSGENSIISKILSLDFDTWEDSLASPQMLVELLSDADKHQHGCYKVPSLRKIADCEQSRFSFARQEGLLYHGEDECSTSSCLDGKGLGMHNYGSNFPSFSPAVLDNNFPKYTVPQSPNSTPPGFPAVCKPPPPGFANHGRTQITFNDSATNFRQTSSPIARDGSIKGQDLAIANPDFLYIFLNKLLPPSQNTCHF